MKFVVIRSGQLKHHDTEDSATKEAIRLINQTGDYFYVAKLIKMGSPAEVVFETLEPKYNIPANKAHLLKELSNLLGNPIDRYGHPWSAIHDELLLYLFDYCHHTVQQLSNIFGRSEVSIRCRLEKFNRYVR